ncbi:MAG: hypothetical protein BWY59_02397 [Verrucomicrobia bacterium ADurb.Bin345]|nr:MAG: hypothetical protein BWY59_02397 [Verrucomicrobia bacterium ADurb.Bin345]
MKWTRWLCVFLVGLVAVQAAQAREGSRPFQVLNRIRAEYDDNIYQETEDKDSSFKLIEEVELRVNLSLDNTFVSLRYRPSFTYWDDRPSDKTDLNHDLDLVLNHQFSPRLGLSLVESLRRGELPELIDGNVVVREKDDFWYNTFNAAVVYRFRPQTQVEVAGRHALLRYDEEEVSKTEDFDIVVGGLTLRHQLVPETAVLGEFRAEQVEYEGPDRGSESLFAGAGVEQIFSPNLMGRARAGYQQKDFNSKEVGSQSVPYGDIALTFLPTPATRISVGAGYSMFETDLYPFASQDRTQIFGSLAYDITARIAFYLTGAYTISEYDSSQAIEKDMVKSGEDNFAQVSTRVTYQVNRSNWIEAGWQFVDFESGVRTVADEQYRANFQRNRVDIGWKTQF